MLSVSGILTVTSDHTAISALQRGDLDALKSAIALGADVNETFGIDDASLLLLSLEMPDDAFYEYLLSHGADPNACACRVSGDGATAMMVAIRADHGHRVRRLLEAGADPRTKDKHGWTALHYAAVHCGVIDDIITALVAHGADINAHDEHGRTPLVLSTYFDRREAFRALVVSGADIESLPNKTDDDWYRGAQALRESEKLKRGQRANARQAPAAGL